VAAFRLGGDRALGRAARGRRLGPDAPEDVAAGLVGDAVHHCEVAQALVLGAFSNLRPALGREAGPTRR
jgi:hypothetical protein